MSYLFNSKNSINSRHMRCCKKNSTFCRYFSKSFWRCSRNCSDRLPMTFKWNTYTKCEWLEMANNWGRHTFLCCLPFLVVTNLAQYFDHSQVLNVNPKILCIDVALSNKHYQWKCECYRMLYLKIGIILNEYQINNIDCKFALPFISTLLGMVMVVSCWCLQ